MLRQLRVFGSDERSSFGVRGVAAKGGEDVVKIKFRGERFAGEVEDGEVSFQANEQARQDVVGGEAFGELDGDVGVARRDLDDGVGTPRKIDAAISFADGIHQRRLFR